MKKPMTTEEHRGYALACLDLAADAFMEVEALGDKKPVPVELSRKLMWFIGKACSEWNEYRLMLGEQAMEDMGLAAPPFIGKVMTAPFDVKAPIVGKQWKRVTADEFDGKKSP